MMEDFEQGERVIVGPDAFDLSPVWEGEIVRYWRNGAWIVRELEFNTTCAYSADRIGRVSDLAAFDL